MSVKRNRSTDEKGSGKKTAKLGIEENLLFPPGQTHQTSLKMRNDCLPK